MNICSNFESCALQGAQRGQDTMFRRPGGTHRHLHCDNETSRMQTTPKSCTQSTHSHPRISENSRREWVNAQVPLLHSVNTRTLQVSVINPQRIKYPIEILERLSLLVGLYPTAVWVRKWPGTWNLRGRQWLKSQWWWQAHTGPNVPVKSFSLFLCVWASINLAEWQWLKSEWCW